MLGRRGMMREAGAAFAVLAVYLLTLLLPLHQAAGLQRDLASLGYETIGAWSICAPLAAEESETPTAVKCPAAGIAKHEFSAPLPAAIALGAPPTIVVVVYEHARSTAGPSRPAFFGQSRAPPATA